MFHFNFIERAEQPELSILPKAWHVGIAYYKGRFHMYNNDLPRARKQLQRAYSLCHREYLENKQRILRYLIPIEMISGKFPSEKLMEQFDLSEYRDVVNACLKGDLVGLEEAITEYRDIYI